MAGHAVRGKHEWGTQEHRRVLNEMKADKGDRRNLADGGDVEPMDADGDRDGDTEGDEMLLEGCAEELMEALQKKDKRAVVEALRALVMNCKG